MAITFLPYFNNIGVSQIPSIDYFTSNIRTENIPAGYCLPAFDAKSWAENAGSGSSTIIVDVGNYTYIDVYKYNSSNIAINIHYQNTVIASQDYIFGNYANIYLGFGADYDSNLGYISSILYSADNALSSNIFYNDADHSSKYFDIISVIQPTPPITYNWQSVPSISGKNGILSKALATIDDEAIGDGITIQVTTDASLFNIPNSSNLYNMVKNLADGEGQLLHIVVIITVGQLELQVRPVVEFL